MASEFAQQLMNERLNKKLWDIVEQARASSAIQMTPGQRRRRAWDLSVPVPSGSEQAPTKPKEPAVYFVRAGEFIKIGRSTAWRERVAALQTGSPHPVVPLLVLSAPPKLERQMHINFRKYRVNGEWFRAAAEIMAYIEEHKAEGLPLEGPVLT